MDVRGRLAAPGAEHIFGTDHYGRDLLTRVILGSRTSMFVGCVVLILSVTIGGVIGLLAGYFGGPLEAVVMRLMDAWMVFPANLLAMAVMASLGPRAVNIVIALTIVYTPRTARVVRGSVLKIRRATYVEAARAVGCGSSRILARAIFPNIVGPLVVQATFIFAFAILAEAALSFLGVGMPPEVETWGTILNQGKAFIQTAPWYTVFPGIAITYTVLGLNLLGDGLRDVFDPRFRGTH
jgi:peptide/nickel transport system permease protein